MTLLPLGGAAAAGLIAGLAAKLGPLAQASAASLPLGMSPALVAILAGIGTSINAFALILFIAGSGPSRSARSSLPHPVPMTRSRRSAAPISSAAPAPRSLPTG
jgi:hypothetical protein